MCTERRSARHAADATIFRGNAIGDSYCCAAPPVPSFSTLCHLVRLGYVPPLVKAFARLGLGGNLATGVACVEVRVELIVCQSTKAGVKRR